MRGNSADRTFKYIYKMPSMMMNSFHFIQITIFYTLITFSRTSVGQVTNIPKRKFPEPFNAGAFKPVITAPFQSTCGLPSRSTFCQSTTAESSITSCQIGNCIQSCPQRTTLPSSQNLLGNIKFTNCASQDRVNRRRGSLPADYSVLFSGAADCFLTPQQNVILGGNGAFTFTVWIWLDTGTNGTLIEKASLAGETIFKLGINESLVVFTYKTTNNVVKTARFPVAIPAKTWNYFAIQMYQRDLTIFLNGLQPGFAASGYTLTETSVKDTSSGVQVRIGNSISGKEPFKGNLQDFSFYSTTLTNREVQQIYNGTLPSVSIQSDCRCLSSHPRVRPDDSQYCIRNGDKAVPGDQVPRLGSDSHLLTYLNDGKIDTSWISSFLNEVNITIELKDLFQVFFVDIVFYSPFPKSLTILRKKNSSSPWQTWQLYASDCKAKYNLTNNGPLSKSDSVNCLQINGTYVPAPFSKGNITFSLLPQEPGIARPGYNNFYSTPTLLEFVEAEQVRVMLNQHFFQSKYPSMDPKHKYYGIAELRVMARCQCNGHAETCTTTTLPYKCACSPESHTEGDKCNKCQPLYNDKPFRMGDLYNSNNCRPCECYNHSDSCVYNATLDPKPSSHFEGGGGVCVNCKYNTVGQHCDKCAELYFRAVGTSLYDLNMCTQCNCFLDGVNGTNLDCDKIGGQCSCRANVNGRRCDKCKDGFFKLDGKNPLGCGDCKCDTNGTLNGAKTCAQLSGACTCKANVREAKCDTCKYGYFNLTKDNKDGCEPCNCNPSGISNKGDCDLKTGQCACKKDTIGGRQCDQCKDGYYDFAKLCIPCNCNMLGSMATTCNKTTGQCKCKSNTQGRKCDECKDKYYNYGVSPSLGCSSCNCDKRGTVNSTEVCDKKSGTCPCKGNVMGQRCNQCKGKTWGLNETNLDGCSPCDCDPNGTSQGNQVAPHELVCDQNTGQCACLSHRTGRRCETCDKKYYVVNATAGGCTKCVCSYGALQGTDEDCNPLTGQCQCKGGNAGNTGKECDKCLPEYFGFEVKTGFCKSCGCNMAGSINKTCHNVTGQCNCKQFVQGTQCDTCITGSSQLDPKNPYGCSKAPNQQPAPEYKVLNASTLSLRWSPPDYPNGVILSYILYRDDKQIFTSFPNIREFNDTGLSAYTEYKYKVQVTNAHGSVTSQVKTARTPPGVPEGNLTLTVTTTQQRSVSLSWKEPTKMNGPIIKYVLTYNKSGENNTSTWEGNATTKAVTGLVPFTNYTFSVEACTTGGCLRSSNVLATTKMDAPVGQLGPNITALNGTALLITWDHPREPNGVITSYELWMRTANGDPNGQLIFNAVGQYNPQSPNNALTAPPTNYTLTKNLEPFTTYEFLVLSKNEIGRAVSSWTKGTTKEAVPLLMPTPVIKPASSYSLNVTWVTPSPKQVRGVVKLYRVYQYKHTNRTLDPYGPPIFVASINEAKGNETFLVVQGFQPYTEHKFMVEVCNSVSCKNSSTALGRTLAAAPSEMRSPNVEGFNSTVMEIKWQPPLKANGPPPYYMLERTTVALNSPPPRVVRGNRFTGGGYYKFPPATVPYDVGFTGIDLWFKTRQRDGLILFAASEGRQEEMIAIQIRKGRPFFIFNPQGCAVEVGPEKDGNRTYNDNAWHRIIAKRNEKLGEVIMDDKFNGCATFVQTTDDEGLPYDDSKWHHLNIIRDGTYARVMLDRRYRGCLTFVQVTDDEGLQYDDSKWHHLHVRRNGTRAVIVSDGIFRGAKNSTCAKGSMIGISTGVYLGGLPLDFEIKRSDTDTRVQVVDKAFQGCLRDIKILQQISPAEVWKPLDFSTAETNEKVLPSWEGCPVDLPKGAHFLGKGYVGFNATVFAGGSSYDIVMTLRTEFKTGLLVFAHGGAGYYTYAQLKDGNIEFGYHTPQVSGTVVYPSSKVNICDGQWKTIKLDRQGVDLAIQVDDGEVVKAKSQGNTGGNTKPTVYHTGFVYVGGMMENSRASRFIKDNGISGVIVHEGFGGCFHESIKFRGRPVNITEEYVLMLNVHLDGCPPNTTSTVPCQATNTVQVANTTDNVTYDTGLGVFSDYIYRVTAANDVGATSSPWSSGRTKEGPPTGVQSPTAATALTGYNITVTWNSPTGNTGLLTKYVLRAYDTKQSNLAPVEATFPPKSGTSVYTGNITTAVPYTNYTIKLQACTSGGCTESKDGVNVTTKEEAPEQIQAPNATDVGATYIQVIWDVPGKPNGIITGYFLHRDGKVVYSGALKSYNVTGLRVYTTYRFHIKACTPAGCKDGPQALLTTAQRSPAAVDAPTLRVQGKREIRVDWKRPASLNGKFESYLLYVSTNSSTFGAVKYNSSQEFYFYVLKDLLAGTKYFIRVEACTGGGCTKSPPSNATTEEDSPEGVPAPTVVSPSPYELIITWAEPKFPNGKLTRYEVWHNNVPVHNTTGTGEKKYQIGGLKPYAAHTFFIRACTKLGCGTSNETKVRTQEAKPEGTIGLTLKVLDARRVAVSWTQPDKPYGLLTYDVYFSGLFYVDPAKWNYTTVQGRKSLLNSTEFNKEFTITGLIPSSTYDVTVNGSNTKGFIISNNRRAVLPSGSPDGVKPPTLTSPSSSSIRATWQSVGRANSNQQTLFQLQFREKIANAIIQQLFNQPTTSTTFLKDGLQPYKEYEFRLNASNSFGFTLSDWASLYTLEDKPGAIDPPMTRNVAQKDLNLKWEHPLHPNGVIVKYKIYINDTFKEEVLGNVTLKKVSGLIPYNMYTFVVEGCTKIGCTKSPASQPVRMLTAAPEGVSPPTLDSQTPTSVLIIFTKPSLPNGVITGYTIERRINTTAPVIVIKRFNANDDLRTVDTTDLLPYTVYQYRLTASTGAGTGQSQWVNVTTRASRPGGMKPPSVRVVDAFSLNITWEYPITPNGKLQSYIIKLPNPRLEVKNPNQTNLLIKNLTAFTLYSVTVTACTVGGGCTESAATTVRTLATKPSGMKPPSAQPISQNMISILWQPPTHPNGPNIKYELARMKIRQPLDPKATDFNTWQRVFQGTAVFYQDKPLSVLTTYKYRVTVFNDADSFITAPSAEVTTYGGTPTVAPVVRAEALDHVSVTLNWTTPSTIELQGYVDKFNLSISSNSSEVNKTYPAGTNSTNVTNLLPNTEYTFTLTTFVNGGGSIKSTPVKARTMDGTPVGLDAPTLTIVNDTALRVTWSAPADPNGQITAYNVYVNGKNISTGMTTPGSFVVNNLQPYTVYSVQMEVCTVYACSKSNASVGVTREALPQLISAPTPQVVNSSAIRVTWKEPGKPNGIILKYEVWRKMTVPCSTVPKPANETTTVVKKCTFIECGAQEALCGHTCYSGQKVCCDGVIHDFKQGYECCGRTYTNKRQTVSDVCCGEKFHTQKKNFQCCGNSYAQVLPGQICCRDSTQDRVDVGFGDGCCGSIPYLSAGAQVCCFGQLHDRFGKKCCGNALVKDTMVCCGNATDGKPHVRDASLTCCGSQYVSNSTNACCVSSTKVYKVHTYPSQTALLNSNEKCCGTERISNGLSCCNNAGYNPNTQVCADKTGKVSDCGNGVVCSKAQEKTAQCDRCDFNSAQKSCHSVPGYYNPSAKPTVPTKSATDCTIGPTKIATVDTRTFSFMDGPLSPYTRYGYAIVVINGAGSGLSDYSPVTTAQAKPEGVSPPKAEVKPGQYDTITLTWDPPTKPNGIISNYLLFREGIGEIYRGTTRVYVDRNLIFPYKTYTYYLRACTGSVGCTDSKKITVATLQARPDGITQPVLNILNSSTIHVKWSAPTKPNGLILNYLLYQLEKGMLVNASSTTFEYNVTGLLPNTNYSFVLSACSIAGCANSTVSKGKTKQDKPQGVSPPTLVVISSINLEVYWQLPQKANGELIYFNLYRRQGNSVSQVQQYPPNVMTMKDFGLKPGLAYSYFIQAATIAGGTNSTETAVTMPTETPTGIKAPANLTALDSTRILVEWEAAAQPQTGIESYKVVLNAGKKDEVESTPFDAKTRSAIIDKLKPFGLYEVRIRACLQNGCGTGPPKSIRIHEAAPTGQKVPTLVAQSATLVEVKWEVPTNPNGIILKYLVYRREFGTTAELLIFFSQDNKTLSVNNADPNMKPFTEYEYKVIAENSKGSTTSPWGRVRTPQAVPQGVTGPVVKETSPYGMVVTWAPPKNPNGIITIYKLSYTMISTDPTFSLPTYNITVPGNTNRTSFSGLKPFTKYRLKLIAVNNAGEGVSPWISVTTGEAAPAGLEPFSVNKLASGRAVILKWNAPSIPNGVITTYQIYEEGKQDAIFRGLFREYQYGGTLNPYTNYTVQLEACTAVGCARGTKQIIQTAEVLPKDQPAPTFGKVNATHVVIQWVRPANANGKILKYTIYRTEEPITGKSKRAVGNPIYTTNKTDGNNFEHVDNTVKPYRRYKYAVEACNSKGCVTSPSHTVETAQAPPSGLAKPVAKHYGTVAGSLNVTWTPPSEVNGILQGYQLKRNSSVPLSFTPTDARWYIERGLKAFTRYSYTITACTGGGCTTSDPTHILTRETPPLMVEVPKLAGVGSTAIKATWTKPQITNGIIIKYILYMDNVVKYEGISLEFTVSGLIPYQAYTFILSACTSGGCKNSSASTGRPGEAPPQQMSAPALRVTSSTSIEVTWKSPVKPNGIITSYEVRRGGTLVNTTIGAQHTDYNLSPGTKYSYTVTAFNSKGNTTGPSASATTYASSPQGLQPPNLQVISNTAIRANWSAPAKPNGQIVNYTLYKDTENVFSAVSAFEYVVRGLEYYKTFSFRVQACTSAGCVTSDKATATTDEAPPSNIGPPVPAARNDGTGAHKDVLVTWSLPSRPNGNVTLYELRRRMVIRKTPSYSYGETLLVFSGLPKVLQYIDNDKKLKPYQEYEYRLTVYNKAGHGNSTWAGVTTYEAPPTSLDAPVIRDKSATLVTVVITPPREPNGKITRYRVVVNGTVRNQSLSTTLTASGLAPWTTYAIQADACTPPGCTRSNSTSVKTEAAKPSGLAAAVVVQRTAISVMLKWQVPVNPNGIISSYELLRRTSCPHTDQPTFLGCNVGASVSAYQGKELQYNVTGLDPYVSYGFLIQAYNQIGPVDFPVWTNTSTLAAAPTYLTSPTMTPKGSTITVDWSKSFKLNGKLVEFIMYTDEKRTYSGLATNSSIEREAKDKKYRFQVKCVTEKGEVTSVSVLFDPSMPNNVGSTDSPGLTPAPQVTMFYQEVWFIALVLVISLLLLFLGIVLCLRYSGRNIPYIRERAPLQPKHKKLPFGMNYCIDPYNGSIIATDPNRPNSQASLVSMKNQPGFVNPAFQRSNTNIHDATDGSIVDLTFDRLSHKSSKYLSDDEDDHVPWDPHLAPMDSGLHSLAYEEDFADTKTYSPIPVTKEQMTFTDTHL